MTLSKSTIASVVGLALVAATALGCGGDSFQDEQIAQVSVNSPEGQGLTLPVGPGIQHGLSQTIQLQSNGDKPLKITSVEMVNTPDLIHHLGTESLGSCTFDQTAAPSYGNCDQQQYCSDTEGTCRDGTPPETPISVSTGVTTSFSFFLGARPYQNRLDCPEAGKDVPEEFRAGYCGEIHIETNASDTGGQIFDEQGNATFYLQLDRPNPGIIKIPTGQSRVHFQDVSPGRSGVTEEFHIENIGGGLLTVKSMSLTNHTNLLPISPSTPVTIPASGSQTFKITLNVPSDYDISQITSPVFLNIQHDDPSTSTKTVTIRLEKGSYFGPAPSYSTQALSFAGETTSRTLTVTNIGSEELVIDEASLEPANLPGAPASISEAYSVTGHIENQGSEGTTEIDLTVGGTPLRIAPGENREITVDYSGSGGEIGQLVFEHNARAYYGSSKISLLANKDTGWPQLTLETFNFLFGQQDTRRFVLRNIGSAPLTITKTNRNTFYHITTDSGANLDDQTIAPGDFARGTVEFIETSEDEALRHSEVSFSNDGLGPAPIMYVNADTDDDSSRSTQIIYAEDQEPPMTVGEPTILKLKEDGQCKVDDSCDMMTSDCEMVQCDLKAPSTITWQIVDRPDSSNFYSVRNPGEKTFYIRPDVPGTYTVAATLRGGDGPETQLTKELTAEE